MENIKKTSSRPDGADAGAVAPAWMAHCLPGDPLASILEALPATRILGAFVHAPPGPVLVPPLFCLCLRAVVPFAVVDAMLQDRYRVVVAVAHHDRHMRLGSIGPNDEDSHKDDGDACPVSLRPTPRPLPWPSPWASYCACRLCCYPDEALGGSAVMPCPRGRLVPIPPRTALRIVAWQWASAVTGCVSAALRWPSAVDVGPCPAPEPQQAATEDGYARDKGAVVRIRPDGLALIGRWPRGMGVGSDDDAQPFQHYGMPVQRVTHPWDARVHVDIYDRTCPVVDEDQDQASIRRHLPCAVARVDGDPVFLVAVYKTTIMTL
ncbi:hypothetical protein pqer_cds_1037 [Pandoravirus quercus]|uniref:Uncharacterized protein n=1 Tax=Pandoravirus quercus TaxID=2107709 RepID=A0A2U7UAK3_9VIRU|nr:hypothetical protein pqer_cds_1037 [Pandoravirus quercus]AVK75459.1 hypothetical protein pqer_cds_1037 [Pandoravirus quercus]